MRVKKIEIKNIYRVFSGIYFWIAFFFILRLIGISNPPLESGHNWRQITGLMVARNFLETNNSIIYPRIDLISANSNTGIIGMEFPILNYLHYLISLVFGYSHWYGRLINLIVSTLGIVSFYKVLKIVFDEKLAFFSTFFLITSIWFAYSRKIMPDTFSISLMFIGIFFCSKYITSNNYKYLFYFILFSSIGILSKIPAGIYFVLILPLAVYSRDLANKTKIIVSLIIPISLCFIWYFKWNFHLELEYGNWYNSGKSISEGTIDIINNLGLTFQKFYFSSFNSYILFVVFFTGIISMVSSGIKYLNAIFFSMLFIFIIYILKSGRFFYHHSYYIIPFVPIMALICGFVVSKIENKKFVFLILFSSSIECIANQYNDFFIKDSEKYKIKLENISNKVCDKNDLIVINGGESPQDIYFSNRKGWSVDGQMFANQKFIDELITKGCKFVFVNKHNYYVALNKKILFSDEDYIVYEL